MKKFRATSLSLALVLALFGCASADEPKPRNPIPDTTTAAPVEPSTPEPTTEEPIEFSSPRVGQLHSAVEEYLMQEEWDFDYDSERERFTVDFSSTNLWDVEILRVHLVNNVIIIDYSPGDWRVPEEARDRLATFAAHYNYDRSYDVLHLDYRDGQLFLRSVIPIEKALPTNGEVQLLAETMLESLNNYGDAIVEVANGADPHQTYAAYYEQP